MKKIVLFIITICMVGLVSAATWDDSVSYDDKNREYTITNTFGLGSEIGRIKLNTPHLYYVPSGYQKVAEITLTNGNDWEDILTGVELFYINDDGSYTEFNRQIDYKIQVPFDKPLYERQCQEQNLNGTKTYTNCKRVQVGTTPSTKWIDFNNTLKENQKVTIGLFTEVHVGDKVEWIPIMYGHHLDEWASWSASLEVDLLAYWELEEVAGNAIDSFGSFDGIINTSIGYGATGKVGDAYDFDRVQGDYINIGNRLNLTGNHNFSIQAWVYPNLTVGSAEIFTTGTGGVDLYLNDGDIWFGGTVNSITNNSDYILNQTWSHLVAVFTTNGTSYLYLNGSRIGTNAVLVNGINPTIYNTTIGNKHTNLGVRNNFSGILDEVAVWNRSLSASEISDLWNGGAGIEFGSLPNVFLVSPPDNTNTTNLTIEFICNTTSRIALDNVTFYLNGVANETNTTGLNNTDYIFEKNLTYGDYNWTCGVYNIDADQANATAVWDITIQPFYTIGQEYNTTSHETKEETFVINITTNGTAVSSANLVYNGSTTSATVTSIGGDNYTIYDTIDIPLGSGTNDFHFDIDIGSLSANSSTTSQFVNEITYAICNSTLTTTYLNITFKNETWGEEFVPAAISSIWNYWVGTGSNFKSLSVINSTENFNYTFCFNNTALDIIANVSMIYENSYSQQRNFEEELDLSNTTTHQVLYLLPTSEGIFVTFQVVNIAEQVISGVSVNVTQAGTLIESATTDDAGLVIFFLDPDETYTFTFSHSSYTTYSTTLQPTQSSYTITLGSAYVPGFDFTRGINYRVKPLNHSLLNSTIYDFNLTLTSSYWEVDSFGFQLVNRTGTVLNSTSLATNGGIVNVELNTFNQTYILMNFYWEIDGNYTNVSTHSWYITDTSGTGFGLNTFFNRLKLYLTSGMFGIDDFALTIIIFLFIFIFVGIMSYKFGGLQSPIPLSILIFGLIWFFDVTLDLFPDVHLGTTTVPYLPTILAALFVIGAVLREGIK